MRPDFDMLSKSDAMRFRSVKNRSNSAADFSAFDPLSQPEAGFRENV